MTDSHDDGRDLCYIAMKGTWNMINFLQLAVNAIDDATKICLS